MMNALETLNSCSVTVTMTKIAAIAAVAVLCGQTQAQTTEDEETLSPIVIDDYYGEEDEAAAEDQLDDSAEESAADSYRLIEDDEVDDWIEPPPQKEQDLAELKRMFDLYRESLINKEYLEADTLAKRVVELSIRVNGLDSHDSAKAITNLGIAQHHNKDFEAAMLNFTASIEIIERIDDRLSSSLINPLQGLAATQASMGRPDLAKQSFQRAVHVSHVNDGPHNSEQVDTLESMAELYISMGEFKDATSIQENIWAIQSRNIDPNSVDILPALEKKAAWQHRLQRYQSERATWRQIINVLERQHGKNSLTLIPPLKALGKSYLFVSPAEYNYQPDVSASSGETHLRRANRIADSNPDSNWETVEDTLLALGDYYVLSGRPNRAARVYEETWALLSEGDQQARLKNRKDHLQSAFVLQKVYPPKYYNSSRTDEPMTPPESFETGTISFDFAVEASGRVSDITHLETYPSDIKDFDEPVARSLRRLIYRPRLADGKMVRTADVGYTHEFFYRPTDLKSADTDDASADESGQTEDNTDGER